MYGASFEVLANGAGTAGTNYSQLRSSGTVSLGNSNLGISLLDGYAPQSGDTLTIITAARVTGTFSQGNSITVESGKNRYLFTITYNATSVVLTLASAKLHPPHPPNPQPKSVEAVAAAGPPNAQAGLLQALAALAAAAGSPHPQTELVEAVPAAAGPPNAQAALLHAVADEEAAITAVARARLRDGHTDLWTATDLALADLDPATDISAAFIP
jgi:hypothetical protein